MRRTRALVAAAGIALAVLFVASPAHADGGKLSEANECSAKAVEKAHEAGTELTTAQNDALNKELDACQKAPNVLLPETNEIIWGAFGFLIVFLFLAKVGYPAVKKGMDARTERIRSDLESADSAKAEASALLDDYRAQLADAKNESARIIEEARQQADSLKRDQEARLQTELAEMRTRAAADVESAKVQAIADLRGEVAALAVGAAEVVVQRNLDRATQAQLVDNYINQVQSRSN